MPRGWEPRFATAEAVKGWEELCRVAAAPMAEAWAVLGDRPARPHDPARQHRLRGRLTERAIGGRTLQQWQYEVAGGGRIWYCPDAERRVVWVVAAAPGHPRVGQAPRQGP
jgi:hypothetical protein